AGGTSVLASSILKVAHHGSRHSSTPLFVDAVGPAWSLISAGRGNRYGHPAPVVVERLRAGGWVLRSDRHGQVRLRWRRGSPVAVTHLGAGVASSTAAAAVPLVDPPPLLD
ncbi:MAG: MBL fold metallo-hydrolase, partial [Thermoanaerobaculia bacterium]|nr:MBL fold metallo-hydrolase [Thermoanaerobaculia bacterium]